MWCETRGREEATVHTTPPSLPFVVRLATRSSLHLTSGSVPNGMERSEKNRETNRVARQVTDDNRQ